MHDDFDFSEPYYMVDNRFAVIAGEMYHLDSFVTEHHRYDKITVHKAEDVPNASFADNLACQMRSDNAICEMSFKDRPDEALEAFLKMIRERCEWMLI